jgi:predicted Fe-Mo cluster-binding NifX family protein
MKIAVTAQGNDLGAPVSPTFGRCPTFIFIDTETDELVAVANPAMVAPGGAGPQAAQLVADHGAKAVLTNKIGPRALGALQAAGIEAFSVKPGTVREALEAYKAGELLPIRTFTM